MTRTDRIRARRLQAIAKCNAGDYAGGIPVLEKVLTDDRIVLLPPLPVT